MRNMRLAALGAIAALLTCHAPAIAADLDFTKSEAAAASYDWSGVNVGIHGGLHNTDITTEAAATPNHNLEDYLVGGQIGYTMQAGPLVYGVEADLSYVNGDSTVPDGNYITQDAQIDAAGSLRGNLGFAVNSFQFYGTGGIALAKVTYGENCPAGVPFGFCSGAGEFSESDSNVHIGWTAGVGAKAALTEALSVGVLYRYSDYGKETYTFDTASERDIDLTSHAVTLRADYKF